MTLTLACTSVTCVILYGCVAIFGLVAVSAFHNTSTGVGVPGNVLDSFPVDDRGAQAMRTVMGLSVTLVYPLLCVPCRSTVHHLIFVHGLDRPPDAPQNMQCQTVETLLIIGFTLVLALCVDDLAKIFGLTGSTAGTLICYVLPLACYLCLRSKQSAKVQQSTRLMAILSLAMLSCLIPLFGHHMARMLCKGRVSPLQSLYRCLIKIHVLAS